MISLALGNYLKLTPKTSNPYYFQNFHINETAQYAGAGWDFVPFGFSGVSINRTGDNTAASLVFPNNQLTRGWAVDAVSQRWTAHVQVVNLDPENLEDEGTLMHQYFGQVASGNWDETSLQLDLNTILDAVGADVPTRRLTQSLIGNIPVSSNVRLS